MSQPDVRAVGARRGRPFASSGPDRALYSLIPLATLPGPSSMLCPLAGLKVIEFEGIGPGPLAGRMLADLGAEVVAVVRPNKAALGDPDSPLSDQPLRRGKRIVTLDLKRPEAVEKALGLDRDGRRADRGQSARGDGAARPRPRRLRQAQSAARLRPHDRLGAGRAACASRGPRSQLCRAERGAVARRPSGRGADPAADGHRRRRRRARPCVRPHERGFRRGAERQGLRHRLLASSMSWRLSAASRSAARASGHASTRPARASSTIRPSTTSIACADGRYVTVGALEPQFYAVLLEKLGLADVDPKAQYDTRRLAGAESAVPRALSQAGRARTGARCSRGATPASPRC